VSINTGIEWTEVKVRNSVTHLIFAAAAGTPSGASSGICRSCGLPGTGASFSTWVRSTFTDFDKLTSGEIVCAACLFCFEDANPVLDARLGKPRQRMRNYSHFVLHGEWFPISKGGKPAMLALIRESPEVAVIAESGQKHIIFRALPGWWQFEETRVRPDVALLNVALESIGPLYEAGFAKAEIASGRYSNYRRILDCGVELWRRCESRIKTLRGSAVFDIALFLAQREEKEQEKEVVNGETLPEFRGDSEQSSLAFVAGGE